MFQWVFWSEMAKMTKYRNRNRKRNCSFTDRWIPCRHIHLTTSPLDRSKPNPYLKVLREIEAHRRARKGRVQDWWNISLKNSRAVKKERSSPNTYFSPLSPLPPKQPRARQTEEAQVTNWSSAICLSVCRNIRFVWIYLLDNRYRILWHVVKIFPTPIKPSFLLS